MKKYFLWISEVIVIIAVLLVINNYLGNQELLIKADGKGYYDYLPATFIYHDLNFKYTDTLQTDYYDQKSYSAGYLKHVNGKQINKYFPGVSILWSPFFAGAHIYALNSKYPADGYSYPYQKSIFFAAIFYLWLGLLYLRRLLLCFNINPIVILSILILFTLATPLLNYVQYDPSFTHVYSFALVNIFSFYGYSYLQKQKTIDFFIAAFILGFITIIRPVNLISAVILLLFFNSFEDFKNTFTNIFFSHRNHIYKAFLIFLAVVSIVPLLWWHQTGQFFIWGYQDEGFNFLSPAFFDFLFSARKGAFVHTPLLFISLLGGLFVWLRTKNYYRLGIFIILVTLITYVLSSWWSWYYGASYGSRPMIEYYIVFAFALAQFLNHFKNRIYSHVLTLLFLFLIPINIIQVFQYQNYIMDWEEMTWDKFRFIGLHTEKKYRGVFFRKTINYNLDQVIYSEDFIMDPPVQFESEKHEIIASFIADSILHLDQVNHVHIVADIEYETGNSEIVLSINDSTGKNIYWYSPHVFAATQKENTRYNFADFYYQIPTIPEGATFQIGVSSHADKIKVHQIKINLIHKP
ncbi:hypothetical protein KFE94_08190 [bacterium SCSIO 12643]|nr:hypothetical protein KFE94_08190 [bacterium SCSIO 12643]